MKWLMDVHPIGLLVFFEDITAAVMSKFLIAVSIASESMRNQYQDRINYCL